VTKEYYINDAGVQIDVLARSVMLRYRQALGENIGEIPEGLYPGDYLVPVGEALEKEYGRKLLDMPKKRRWPSSRTRHRRHDGDDPRDLDALNVHHDVFFSERDLHADGEKRIRTAINELTLNGHVYKGQLPPPKGQLPDDWEDREQTLFRSTAVGDDIDRPLVKSDGSYTYFAADVAYFMDKYKRGFEEMIYVLGADHGGYVKRMEAVGARGCRRQGKAHRVVVPTRQAASERRAGTDVETRRPVRDAARRGRRGRPRSGAVHDALPEKPGAARFRFRQGDRAIERQSGLLRPVRQRALRLGDAPGARDLPGPRPDTGNAGVGRSVPISLTRASWR
jgi:arginyl-tRNA synthetase